MSLVTLNTSDVYVGNGAATNFPITFEYTNPDHIFPTVDEVIVGFTYDNALAPTEVIFDVAPGVGAAILVQRTTPKTQQIAFADADVEAQFDKVTAMIQEVEAGATVFNLTSDGEPAIFQEWAISTDYLKNQLLRDGFNGRFYTVDDDYTSNAVNIETDISAGKLELFNQGETGETGPIGPQGIQGAAGANGTNGGNGAAGADGIFVAIANQVEAEAGTDNVKGMTALRTKQAIAENIGQFTTTVDIDLKNTAQDLEISRLKQRVTTLESNLEINQFDGKQRIKNNELVPESLLGKDADVAELGFGDQFWLNKNGAEFARISCLIKRTDNLEERFVQVTLVLHYIGATWFIGRESTVVLNDGEPDGLVFTVVTNGDVGTVHYTSDNMLGTNYEGEIFWQGKEIPATIEGLVN